MLHSSCVDDVFIKIDNPLMNVRKVFKAMAACYPGNMPYNSSVSKGVIAVIYSNSITDFVHYEHIPGLYITEGQEWGPRERLSSQPALQGNK